MPSLSFVTLLPCFVAKTRKREFLGLRASCRWSREGVMHCAQEELKGPSGTDSEQRAPSPGSCTLTLPGKYAGPGSLQTLRVGLCPIEGTPSHGEGGPSPSLRSKCGQTDRSSRKSWRLGAKAVWMWGACPQVLSGCQQPAPGTAGPRGATGPGSGRRSLRSMGTRAWGEGWSQPAHCAGHPGNSAACSTRRSDHWLSFQD